METAQNTLPEWYVSLTNAFNKIASEMGLGQEDAFRLRQFIADQCKENYKRGSRSGAAWAFKKKEAELKGGSQPPS